MNNQCPHCILKQIERRIGIKFSSDFAAGFAAGAIFYPALSKKKKVTR
jgi:hypothetical protein